MSTTATETNHTTTYDGREAAASRVVLKRAARRMARGMAESPEDAMGDAFAAMNYTGRGTPLDNARKAYATAGNLVDAVHLVLG